VGRRSAQRALELLKSTGERACVQQCGNRGLKELGSQTTAAAYAHACVDAHAVVVLGEAVVDVK
jgi:hypothetical protein